MDPVKQSPRLTPLAVDYDASLKENFATVAKNLGFVPNSVLIMQRRPEITKAYSALYAAIWGPSSTVENGLKRLIAHLASRSAGCMYCIAHTAGGALHLGVEEQKVRAVWEYQTSPLFTPAERAALDVAVAAGCTPNAVTDEMFVELRKHWSEGQIVEIVATISMFGFLNRFNDTMATPLEQEPTEVGERMLVERGWVPGKHLR